MVAALLLIPYQHVRVQVCVYARWTLVIVYFIDSSHAGVDWFSSVLKNKREFLRSSFLPYSLTVCVSSMLRCLFTSFAH